MHAITPRHLLFAALLCLATLAQAQVTPPMRADIKLNGNDAGGRSNGTLASCHDLCKSTPGCSGFSFAAPVAGSKPLCWLFSGSLTEAAKAGVVSCRMPCEPAVRASKLTQRQPVTTLRPAPPTTLLSSRPASLPPRAAVLPLQPAPAAPVAGAGTASTQAASFGTGIAPSTNLPPCVPGRVTVAGSCSNAAVAATPAPADVTVTLVPINDNTLASSGLNAVYENSVYPSNYWFASTPGIGMGCDQLFVALSGAQYLSCARGLVKFDLATLAGKTIQGATLSLTTSAHGVGSYKDPWYVAASASAWSGAAVTWINYGDLTYTPSISIQNAPTSAGQVFNLDQTTTVRNWLSGAYANNGFAMALRQEQLRHCGCVSLDHFEFHSSEDGGGRGPKLIVTYR